MNTEKCLSPARSMEILGIVVNSIKRTCYLPDEKVEKYISRLKYHIKQKSATKKELEQIIGNLVFAAWVLPFGRTFISHISFFLYKKPQHKTKRWMLSPSWRAKFGAYCLERIKAYRLISF